MRRVSNFRVSRPDAPGSHGRPVYFIAGRRPALLRAPLLWPVFSPSAIAMKAVGSSRTRRRLTSHVTPARGWVSQCRCMKNCRGGSLRCAPGPQQPWHRCCAEDRQRGSIRRRTVDVIQPDGTTQVFLQLGPVADSVSTAIFRPSAPIIVRLQGRPRRLFVSTHFRIKCGFASVVKRRPAIIGGAGGGRFEHIRTALGNSPDGCVI